MSKELLILSRHLYEDLQFPALTTQEPNIPNYDSTSVMSTEDMDEYEQKVYSELVAINNNYISSILAIEEEIVAQGMTEKRLSTLAGLLNEYRNVLYQYGNKYDTDKKLSTQFKSTLFSQYTYGIKFCRQKIDSLINLILDNEFNEIVVDSQGQLYNKQSIESQIESGKIPFKAKKLNDNQKKKLERYVQKLRNDTKEQKISLSKILLNLKITQDAIKTVAYLNPLSAVIYELYNNVYSPISNAIDKYNSSKQAQKDSRFNQVQKLLNTYLRNNNINIGQLKKYISDKKDLKLVEVILSTKNYSLGNTNAFNLERFMKNNKISFQDLQKYANNYELVEIPKTNKYQQYIDDNNIDLEDIYTYNDTSSLYDEEELKDKKIGDISYSDFKQFLSKNKINSNQLLKLISGEDMNEQLQMGQNFPLKAIINKSKKDFKNNEEIIDYIEDTTDYTVVKDNGTTLEVKDINDINRPSDFIYLDECLLIGIAEITEDGITVFMPSGFQAELSQDGDNIIADYYTHKDTYSVDEFGQVVKDGIIKIEEPSQKVMEDYSTHQINDITRLDRISKVTNNIDTHQQAITLMNDVGLGVNRKEQTDELKDKLDKELKDRKDESINEISDELKNKVKDRRLDDFVNSNPEDMEDKYKKLRKNIKLNNEKYRKKDVMSEITEVIKKLKEAMEVPIAEDEQLNEISDDLASEVHSKRFEKLKDTKELEKSKFKKYSDIRDRFNDFDIEQDDIEDLEKDLEDAEQEFVKASSDLKDADKKFKKNVDLMVDREFRKNESKEVNEDIGGLTDINDIDLPAPLADTIEVTDEGNVLTLEVVYNEIKNLKDSLVSSVQSIKDSVNSQISELKNEILINKEADKLDDIDTQVDELTSELTQEQPQEDLENEDVEDIQIEDEQVEEVQESVGCFSKFIKKGAIDKIKEQKVQETLDPQVKTEIDQATQQGKSAEEIKDIIDLNVDDEKDKKDAKDYAADKLQESALEKRVSRIKEKLNSTRDNSAINNAKYNK